ncbi:MAG: alpha/beta hydrolase family protein [Parachlamydiales bacterium]
MKTLPIPIGSYQVGIAKYDLTDPCRKEIEHPHGRLIPIQIYFPIGKGSHSQHHKVFEERVAGNWPPLDVEVYSRMADLTLIEGKTKHPLILLNHGDTVAMTDYGFIAEDLASHGYVVVAIQHQLNTDPEEPTFWKQRSCSRYGKVIDNILYVFQWLQDNQTTLFNDALDLKKVGLIGHSMGGNALLLLASRASCVFKEKQKNTLLPHVDSEGVKEALIVMDTGGFPYPAHDQYPLFLLLSEEREDYQKKSGAHEEIVQIGHQVKYYKGSKHISFMDHGYIDPPNPVNPEERYFNGTLEERKLFFDQVRKDIREFLVKSCIGNSVNNF